MEPAPAGSCRLRCWGAWRFPRSPLETSTRRADFANGGNAYCWGLGGNGELGNGVTGGNSLTPVVVSGGFTFRQVDAGAKSNLFGGTQSHTCGVTTTGAGYCWGFNSLGELGTGTGSVNVPTPVLGSLNFLLISAGEADACGLTRQGLVYCWGFGAGLTGTPQLQLEP